MIKNRLQRSLIIITLLLLVSGCGSITYYSQSVVGHSRLMLARQPLDKAIEQAEPPLRSQLLLATELLEFAQTELGLPNNKSYTSYVPLDREYPVWTVVAAPEFSLNAKQWCYPVIGCASYRGYFSQVAAQNYASRLKRKGFETAVGGAVAYSTLGWFNDPLLPSMMRHGEGDFAEVLFHELAHQKLYINGDSEFNEAFATVVGEQGTRRWLARESPDLVASYEAGLAATDQFSNLIDELKRALNVVYDSDKEALDKRTAKHAAFDRFAEQYQHLKQATWGGQPWFDGWLKTPINNARLAAFATYRERVPKLRKLLQDCGGDFDRYFALFADAVKHNGRVVVPDTCH